MCQCLSFVNLCGDCCVESWWTDTCAALHTKEIMIRCAIKRSQHHDYGQHIRQANQQRMTVGYAVHNHCVGSFCLQGCTCDPTVMRHWFVYQERLGMNCDVERQTLTLQIQPHLWTTTTQGIKGKCCAQVNYWKRRAKLCPGSFGWWYWAGSRYLEVVTRTGSAVETCIASTCSQ